MNGYFQDKINSYNRVPTVQWKQKWIDHQHIEPNYYDLEKGPKFNEMLYGAEKTSQFSHAVGNTYGAFASQMFFVYLGALVQAKKQNIPGLLFFRNRYYNFVGGLKYIAIGYFVGMILNTFAFGKPYLLEDYVRSKFRGLLAQPKNERNDYFQ